MKKSSELAKPVPTFSWEYLAGLFDGEGWTTCPLNKGYPSLRVCIAQSGDIGYKLLSDVRDWLSKQGIVARVHVGKLSHKATMVPYRLVIAQKDSAYRFIESVKPYLHVKQEQACETVWKRELYWLAKETARPADFKWSEIERCVI